MSFLKDKIKEIGKGQSNKKKIENIAVLIIILIITILIINMIMKDETETNKKENVNNTYKTLAITTEENENVLGNSDLEAKLEKILVTIKGVGKVNVFINYSESSKMVAMYDEKTTTSSTEETDSAGGLRNTVSTETQKDVIYSEENGNQVPMTESVVMPVIEGAIITAQGASNTTVKANIINAVGAATGLSINKIQVFEME